MPKISLFLIGFFLSFSIFAKFEPFFDDKPGTRLQPVSPVLTELDKDVLKLCGNWGAIVKVEDFEKMLLKPKHRPVLKRIYTALAGKIFRKTSELNDFIRQLSRVWFGADGFKHVFCGEPGKGKDLGGLHYAPRYLEAQQKGWAGFRKLNSKLHNRKYKCRAFFIKDKTDGRIFNISVIFKNPRLHKTDVKCLSGYHLELDAEKLLIAGTRAFKAANKRAGKNTKEACYVETKVAGVEPHYSNLVIKKRALRTFYPMTEKKPFCKKNRRNFKACLCANLRK